MTVANVVLGRRQDIGGSQRAVGALEPSDGSRPIGCTVGRNLAVALVRTPPPNILRGADAWSECPADAGAQYLVTCHLRRLRDQGGIVSSSHANIVWK